MISFQKPTRETLLPFLKMELTPEQTEARLVAPNAVTLAQAAYEPASEVYEIWDDEIPVGLIALWDPAHPDADVEDGDDPESLFLWRLFIDKAHQRQGYGTKALDFCLKRATEMDRPKLYTSAVEHPLSAQPVYEKFGFQATGRIIDDCEIELVIEVT